MAEEESFFSNIKIENGNQVIDIDQDMEKYEFLSIMFHKPTVALDPLQCIVTTNKDKRRYFENNTVCYKCGEIGHLSKDCTKEVERMCMYCATQHKGRTCDFLFCDLCMRLGHTSRFCREKRPKPGVCQSCKQQAHLSSECPRHWRRYKICKKKLNANIVMSCPLCFDSTHFIDDCEIQDRQFTIFTKNYLGK